MMNMNLQFFAHKKGVGMMKTEYRKSGQETENNGKGF